MGKSNFGASKTLKISIVIIILLSITGGYFLNKWYKHQLTLPKS